MSAAHVELVREGPLATLRFANPPRHTLTAEMVASMHAQLDALVAAPLPRVLVLRSATPGAFITHYEVGELSRMADRSQEHDGPARAAPAVTAPVELHALNTLTLRLESLATITVAVIDGLAMGGGLELALGCDLRVVRQGNHVLGLPETSVGIIPGAGGTQRLARLLGVARTLDLVLHGALLTPDQALAAGLVHRVLDAERFDAEVAAFLANLAARAPIALAEAKRAIREGLELPLHDALRLEQTAFARTLQSADARNAMRAYLKGERYEFKGE